MDEQEQLQRLALEKCNVAFVDKLDIAALLRWGIFSGTERNGNGTEVAVVAYLDCIHDRVSIIFIVFIGNTLLPGFSTY